MSKVISKNCRVPKKWPVCKSSLPSGRQDGSAQPVKVFAVPAWLPEFDPTRKWKEGRDPTDLPSDFHTGRDTDIAMHIVRVHVIIQILLKHFIFKGGCLPYIKDFQMPPPNHVAEDVCTGSDPPAYLHLLCAGITGGHRWVLGCWGSSPGLCMVGKHSAN